MLKTDINDLLKFSEDYKTVPVMDIIENAKDIRGPVDVFKSFKNISRHCFILESLADKNSRGRWTFLGFSPKLEVSAVNGCLTIKNGTEIQIKTDNPVQNIQRIIEDNKSPAPSLLSKEDDIPPFTGGLVGYFSFEFLKYSEPGLKKNFENSLGDSFSQLDTFKDFDVMLFDKLVCWDHLTEKLIIIINIKTDALRENYNDALREIDSIKKIIAEGKEADIPKLKILSPFEELSCKAAYCKMVEEGKRYIKEGDIFQVVLANQMKAQVEGSLFGTYKVLREINPSPYMFYFSSDDIEIAGASPETLVKLKDGKLWTFPLAGTRARGKTEQEDNLLEQELLADPKEIAEHNMLVDLGRNDIGKLSEFNSVVVEKYMGIERFSHVMHIGSTVSGTIKNGYSALDAISAVLPAGTLSGAPKIRACEIITELEGARRGIYGGALGYIALNGNMDTCISIRIAYKKNNTVYVRSGAGIVADSVPEKEYEECRNKMKATLSALEAASK
jgi:anthranilate synthase component 1